MKPSTKRDLVILIGLVALFGLAAAPSVSAQGNVTKLHVFTNDGSGSPPDWFTVTGYSGKNPKLVLPPGDYEAIVHNNGTTGHNFHVGGPVNKETPVDGPGTTDYLNFTIPSSASYPFEYWCVPHKSAGMKGTIYKTQSDANNGGGGGSNSPGFTTVGAVAAVGIALLVLQRQRNRQG